MEQNRTQGSSPRLIATLAALGACAGIAMAPAASAGDGSVKTNDARSEKAVKLDPASQKVAPGK